MTNARVGSQAGTKGERKAATLEGRVMPETVRPAAKVAPMMMVVRDSSVWAGEEGLGSLEGGEGKVRAGARAKGTAAAVRASSSP